MNLNKIYLGDCLVENEKIDDSSVDLILIDPPYGNMKGCKIHGWQGVKTDWDIIINTKDIFSIANRILRVNGRLIIFSQEPYTNNLINNKHSNLCFNYRMIWEKNHYANNLYVNKAMVNYYEDILLFTKEYDTEFLHPLRIYSKKILDYIGLNLKQIEKKLGHRKAEHFFYYNTTQFDLCTENTYAELIDIFNINSMVEFKTFEEIRMIHKNFLNSTTFNLWQGNKYKSNILKYDKESDRYHPTQKPILLLEDLIKTFSNEGDLVVDFTAGSGSTGVACKNTNRNYILIEKEKEYFDISCKRLNILHNNFSYEIKNNMGNKRHIEIENKDNNGVEQLNLF